MKIRAIYQHGHLELLDPVTIPEGQQVDVTIHPIHADDVIREALGDIVRWPDAQDNRHVDVEDQASEIEAAFSQGKAVSDYIIEDRGEI